MVHTNSMYNINTLCPSQTWEIYLYLTYRFRGASNSLKIPITVFFQNVFLAVKAFSFLKTFTSEVYNVFMYTF